jgi:hypothetical protein
MQEDQPMKTKYPLFSLSALALLLMASSGALAQTTTTSSSIDNNYNHPPCDFNDAFYTANGINVTQLNTAAGQRFGLFRQFGAPASGTQANWVSDPTCSTNDPNAKNIRILATTGGYRDDSGTPTEFISLIAFLTNQNFFTGVANKRNIQMIDIVGHFEAYVAVKQRLSDGTFVTNPCGTMGTGKTPCFQVKDIATPNLRQDWRFSTNRNSIDGTNENNPLGKGPAFSNSPFGYFCDDILGMWIVTHFWFTVNPANPGPTCGPEFARLAAKNGLTLDGSPILKTGDELDHLGDLGCAKEGNLAVNGADGGPVWAICPAIMDPRNGAIAKDAFLDQVKTATSAPLDPAFNANFNCLQTKGNFPQPDGSCVADNTGL